MTELIWTDEDVSRATREGWRRGYYGNLFPLPHARFRTDIQVYKHVRNTGRTSEWHRNVFLASSWGVRQHTLALEEGWVITRDTDTSPLRIEFLKRSKLNQESLQRRAENGDPLALAAILFVAKTNLTR